jgi:hypothetical protein
MAIRTVLALGIFALLCGTGSTQISQPTRPPQNSALPDPGLPGTPHLPTTSTGPRIGAVPSLPSTSAAQLPKEKSLDQLLDELEAIRAKKVEMEKAEQELVKAIQQKSTKQAERMKQLGLNPAAATDGPKRVGRIIIEGNTVTTDGKILKMLKLRSGTVLEYPKLEEFRARLKKAGFQETSVELINNEWDSIYQDILVKVKEKE